MKIALLSNHAWGTANKAGFHMLAASYAALGHEVMFVTTGLSLFSAVRRDARLRTGRPLNRLVDEGGGVWSYLHFTALHPHTLVLRPLDRLSAPLVRRYDRYGLGEAAPRVAAADVVFFESCSALCLVGLVRRMNPRAKLVYRASDVITRMRSLHPEVAAVEQEVLPAFDLVSVPTPCMAGRLGAARRVVVHRHGVDTAVFEAARSPYSPGSRNAIFVGMSDLDSSFLEVAARRFPEVTFNVVGPFRREVAQPNVAYHGKLPFAVAAGYVKFADVALTALRKMDSALLESFGTSLKMNQYRYCGLPVVIPDAIPVPWQEGCFRYRFGDAESICEAMAQALSAGRDPTRGAGVCSWRDVAAAILGDLEKGEGKSCSS